MGKMLPMFIEGTGVSLQVFFLTLFFSVPLGFLVAFGRMSRVRVVRESVGLYILIMRGTPLILQIIFIAFAPYYIFSVTYDRFVAVIISFSINYAAYFAEIFRGGIESMPRGQYEAAACLGFTKTQTFFKIILPQVIKRILPASSNEVITLVKDTALAQVIGVTELFSLAQKQMNNIGSIMPLFVAGVFYFVMNWAVSTGFNLSEKKLSYYR